MKEAGYITICMGLGSPGYSSQACGLPLAGSLPELPFTYMVLCFENSVLEELNLWSVPESSISETTSYIRAHTMLGGRQIKTSGI